MNYINLITILDKIQNKMGKEHSFLPGSEYYINFKTGDPFTKVQEGELRLPGKGYEARYTELKDINPANYPLIHKYRILADVAPYSDEYRQMKHDIRNWEYLTDDQLQEVREIEKQVSAKKEDIVICKKSQYICINNNFEAFIVNEFTY